ncbi:MAG: hypothetical protein HQK83_04600 [Fibrobacteria bacterium]|nr:hypothetical protein [Fibrobacteria bacterium]
MRKGNRASTIIITALNLLIVTICFSQDVNLVGTLTDDKGTAIPKANITLTGKDISTTSDSLGKFLITDDPSSLNHIEAKPTIQLKGSQLNISQEHSGGLFVGLYNVKGNQLAEIINTDQKSIQNSTTYSFEKQSTGVQILKVETGDHQKTFKIVGLSQLCVNISNRSDMLSKQTSIIDELIIKANGFQKKRVTLASYIDTLNIILQKAVEGPYLIFNDLFLAYDTVDAGKTVVKIPKDRGNKLLLNLSLENIGDENALSVTCSLSTVDPYITVTKPVSGFNNIESGTDTLNFEPYEVVVTDSIPPARHVSFQLHIKDSWGGVWRDSCVYVMNPFIIESQNIDDDTIPDSYGNGNKLLDPNEIVEYTPRLENKSEMVITELYGRLLSKSEQIVINDTNDIWGYGNFVPDEKHLPKWDYVFKTNTISSAKFDLFLTGKVNGVERKWLIPFSLPINNIAPIIDNPGNKTVKETKTVEFMLSATDINDDSLSYSMLTDLTEATLIGNLFKLTPNYDQDGDHNIGFVVSDNGIPSLSDSVFITITVIDSPVLVDSRDSNVYEIITIGTQVWMAENLKYLPQVDNVTDGTGDVSSDKYYYVYDYTPTGGSEAEEVSNAKVTTNYLTYGVLYNWNAAMNGSSSSSSNPSGVQGVCPDGWHLPSEDEWQQLEMEIGMSQTAVNDSGYRETTEGEELKATSFGGTDEHGFKALLSGVRYNDHLFINLGSTTCFWSATENDASNAWRRYLRLNIDLVERYYYNKNSGFSVRCLQNLEN